MEMARYDSARSPLSSGTVNQAWATSGPRATCGPSITLMWPANLYQVVQVNIYVFLIQLFIIETDLKCKNPRK